MEATFVVVVLFLGHFIVTNAGGELLFQERSDTQSECHGDNCVTLNARVNRRSLFGVGENLPAKKSILQESRENKNSPINIEKKIHKAADKKITHLLKTANYNRKDLTSLAKKGSTRISSLVKMSRIELQKLTDQLSTAKGITLSSCDAIMIFLNSTVAKMQKMIERTGEDIKELAETYWKELVNAEVSHIEAVRERRETVAHWEKLIRKIRYCTDRKLMHMFTMGDAAIRTLAATSGDTAMKSSSKDCGRYQSIVTNNSDLQDYIGFSCERITILTDLCTDKFYKIAEASLQFILRLTNNSNKRLKELSAKLIAIIHAVNDRNDKKAAEITAGIQKIYRGMDHSNKQIFKDMVSNQKNAIIDLYNSMASQINSIKDCQVDQVSRCTSGFDEE